jgi:hypothetical protein
MMAEFQLLASTFCKPFHLFKSLIHDAQKRVLVFSLPNLHGGERELFFLFFGFMR